MRINKISLLVFLASLLALLSFSRPAEAAITPQPDGYYLVDSGNDLKTAVVTNGYTNIRLSQNITLPSAGFTLKTNTSYNFDGNGFGIFAMTQVGATDVIQMATGDAVVLMNYSQTATTTTATYASAPNAAGTGTTTAYWNNYYGLFSGSLTDLKATMTYQNCTFDYGSITAANVQMFYTYGVDVSFSGNNHFVQNSTGAQEFMEGYGWTVLDGTTTIDYLYSNIAYGLISQANAAHPYKLDVNAGATLNINAPTLAADNLWYWYTAPTSAEMIINGTLNINAPKQTLNFLGGAVSSSAMTFNMTFGPNSQTNITAGPLWSFDNVNGAFNTSIGSNASFTYNQAKAASTAFAGTPNTSDSFIINNASLVSIAGLGTGSTTASAVFGTNTAMPIQLQVDSTTGATGYTIGGFTNVADTTAAVSSAINVTGNINPNLANMATVLVDNAGTHPVSTTDQGVYQKAKRLVFTLVPGILQWVTSPIGPFQYEHTVASLASSGGLLTRTGAVTDMNFGIMDTRGATPNFNISLAATPETTADTLPANLQMEFLLANGTALPINTAATTLFTGTSMTSAGSGLYTQTYPANQGLVIQATDDHLIANTYNYDLTWTLTSALQ
ncbi:MAG: hypothetical protein LBT80_01970 [Lactobacillaceae bacterium]|jgi:hypothetical protein|nr:hypothetical protein [Lactobacillaceae bacterium]